MRTPLRFSTTTSRRQAHKQLERVVYEPLQACQSSDHDDPDWEAVPQAGKPDLAVDTAQGPSERLPGLTLGVQLADHDICGMGDDRAKNTGQVTTSESDKGLSALAVISLLARKITINGRDDGFKGGEFHHGVWNLPAPESVQTLVQTGHVSKWLQNTDAFHSPCGAFFGRDGADALQGASKWRWNRCLHPDFDRLQRAETKIGKEFSRGGGTQEETGLPLFRLFLSHKARVKVLEVFIAPVLDRALD